MLSIFYHFILYIQYYDVQIISISVRDQESNPVCTNLRYSLYCVLIESQNQSQNKYKKQKYS
jgi:hypothetical protein